MKKSSNESALSQGFSVIKLTEYKLYVLHLNNQECFALLDCNESRLKCLSVQALPEFEKIQGWKYVLLILRDTIGNLNCHLERGTVKLLHNTILKSTLES